MKNFVEAQWLKDNLKDVVVIDARYDLHNKSYGRETYLKSHIPGAYYLDLDEDLAGVKEVHGGSRPLPNTNEFIKKIEQMGITSSSNIVIYDENMITGSRAFWMFRYLGHKKVRLLNGGIKSWIESGGSLTNELPVSISTSNYTSNINDFIYSDINYVKALTKESILVECRSYERYLGLNEPFYNKAGHIPKAICIDSKSLLRDDKILPPLELVEAFNRIKSYSEVVFYCGSGVNASLVFVALDEIGGKGKVYLGSFSDWISYDENPVEVKDEN